MANIEELINECTVLKTAINYKNKIDEQIVKIHYGQVSDEIKEMLDESNLLDKMKKSF